MATGGALRTNPAVLPDIVVWEWQDDFGQWIPYDAQVCDYIERHSQKSSIELRNVKPSLTAYVLDLKLLHQENTQTYGRRRIQRRIFSFPHVLVEGYHWQWDNAFNHRKLPQWTTYSTDVMDIIEQNYKGKQLKIDLQKYFRSMPYKIDLKKNIQKNIHTGYEREIRRVSLLNRYPSPSPPQYQWNPVSQPSSNHHITTYNSSFSPHSASMTPSAPPTNMVGPVATTPAVPFQSIPTTASTNLQTAMTNLNISGSTLSSQFASSTIPNGSLSAQPSKTSSLTGEANKKTEKRVTIPPCPAGGIPCSATGSSLSKVPIDKVVKSFMNSITIDPKSTDDCAICQSPLNEASGFGTSADTLELNLCKHVFHRECTEASYSHGVQNGCFVCPSCNKMHGIKTGTQPPGYMTYTTLSSSLPGHTGHKTIQVTYNIQSGIQSSEHPHPGKHFSTPGFPRIGYLPDNNDGRRVLLLLIEAWKRRLIFMVGQSSTTGMDDCVTWTGIHHKTETQSRRGHGYPDDDYLDRVMMELAAEGVIEEEM